MLKMNSRGTEDDKYDVLSLAMLRTVEPMRPKPISSLLHTKRDYTKDRLYAEYMKGLAEDDRIKMDTRASAEELKRMAMDDGILRRARGMIPVADLSSPTTVYKHQTPTLIAFSKMEPFNDWPTRMGFNISVEINSKESGAVPLDGGKALFKEIIGMYDRIIKGEK